MLLIWLGALLARGGYSRVAPTLPAVLLHALCCSVAVLDLREFFIRQPQLRPWQPYTAWAHWLAAGIGDGLSVFAYFNNDTGGHAPRDAVRLRDRVHVVVETARLPLAKNIRTGR